MKSGYYKRLEIEAREDVPLTRKEQYPNLTAPDRSAFLSGRIKKPATRTVDSTPAAVNGAEPRICEHCGRPLNERSSYTRHDVPFHKKCWIKSEERRELQRLMGAFDDTPENPLKGLL